MLVLSRQKGESIVICDKEYKVIAEITIVDVRGDKVRLGIEVLDKSIPVHRKEVYEAIMREKKEAQKQ